MTSFDCFIFDFDGTLARSEGAYSAAFSHTIRRHTGQIIDEAEFREYWNLTPQEVLRRYGEATLDDLLLSFEEHYYANHHLHLIAYEGIIEALDLLNRRAAHLAIVSLKPRRAGELELDITGLAGHIELAIWGDDVDNPKPEPDGVLRALRHFDANPQRTLVIGDSPSDILMGQRAGTRTAAALWSGVNRERLMSHAPDHLFDSPQDLIRMVGNPNE